MKLMLPAIAATVLLGIFYVCRHLWKIVPFALPWKIVMFLLFALWFATMFLYGRHGIDRMSMPMAQIAYKVMFSFVFVLLYLGLVFMVLDLGRLFHIVPKEFLNGSLQGTLAVLGTMILLFSVGSFRYDRKVRIPLEIKTSKNIEKPLKVVMASDLHLGYNIGRKEFAKWVDLINAEKPDMVLIGGDILDGNIRPVEEEKMYEEFHRIEAPVYACLGNHEFYTGTTNSYNFYEKAGIHLLDDAVAEDHGTLIIGRKDRTDRARMPLTALTDELDKSHFMILLDHQPYALEEAEQQGIDFQFSGHTHYGQVWPVSWIERLMYENPYGSSQRSSTRYYVSSGMGIWGCKFRIGTRSEYVVLDVIPSE